MGSLLPVVRLAGRLLQVAGNRGQVGIDQDGAVEESSGPGSPLRASADLSVSDGQVLIGSDRHRGVVDGTQCAREDGEDVASGGRNGFRNQWMGVGEDQGVAKATGTEKDRASSAGSSKNQDAISPTSFDVHLIGHAFATTDDHCQLTWLPESEQGIGTVGELIEKPVVRSQILEDCLEGLAQALHCVGLTTDRILSAATENRLEIS